MALLERLFGKRRRSARAEAPAAPPAQPKAAEAPGADAALDTVPEVQSQLAPEPASPSHDPVEEDDPDEDPTAVADDPTIGMYEALQIDTAQAGVVDSARRTAESFALAGPHRITPNDPVGPGSLAEALMALEKRGLVVSQVVEDAERGFHLLYVPVKT